jgi:APA family basic amino acid/polyamine antiporter
MSNTARRSQTLVRGLGPIDAAAIVVANVIGVGIFTTPAMVASMVPNPLALLALWITGGVLAFAGAMAYAELATRYPRSGGEYVYLNESYGRLMGFLTGWTSFVAGFSGAIAAAATACAGFLGRFLAFADDTEPLAAWQIGPLLLHLSPRVAVAIAIIALVSFVHIRGLDTGKALQNTLTVTKVAVLLCLAAVGIAVGWTAGGHVSAAAPVRLGAWTAAMIPVMFSYSGWNAAAYVAEEIRDPRRNLPRALALGTLVVVVIYVGVNAAYLLRAPGRSLDADPASGFASDALLGSWTGSLLTAVTIVIILSSISAMVLAGPRVYYAMARDGLFFSSAARVHPRYRTPYVATIAQAVWASLLVATGTFEQLLMYTGFAVVLFAGVAVASLFVIRRREGSSSRAFSAWGYPAAPALFCLTSLLIIANAIREAPTVVATGFAIVFAGVPVYWWLTRTARLRAPGDVTTAATPNLSGTPVLNPPA